LTRNEDRKTVLFSKRACFASTRCGRVCWFVIYFANAGVITGSLMLILGADILIAGLH
jgi:hypothetical protein